MANIVDIRVAPEMRYGLVYNGTSQRLIIDGIVEGGHLEYCLFEDVPPTDIEHYSREIPSATDAGTYYIAYIAVADEEGFVSDDRVRTLASYITKAQNALYKEPNTYKFEYDYKEHALCDKITSLDGIVSYYVTGEAKIYSNPPMKKAPGNYRIEYSVSETDNYYGISRTLIGTSVIYRTSTCFETKPAAVTGLRFNNEQQILCTEGEVKWGGLIKYAVRTPGNYPEDDSEYFEYSQKRPVAKEPGKYEVWYRMYDDQGRVITMEYAADGINDSEYYVNSKCLTAIIDRAETAYIEKPSVVDELVYDGDEKTLAVQGQVKWDGYVKYSPAYRKGEIVPQLYTYSTELPKAVDAGEYCFRYIPCDKDGNVISNNIALDGLTPGQYGEELTTVISKGSSFLNEDKFKWVLKTKFTGKYVNFLKDGYVPGTDEIPKQFGTWLNVYLSRDNEKWFSTRTDEGNSILFAMKKGDYDIYYKIIPDDSSNYTESKVYHVVCSIIEE